MGGVLKDIPDNAILDTLNNTYKSDFKTEDNFHTLENYIEKMSLNEINKWTIGWESLPKYIGHMIYNINTKQVATVQWDIYPKLIDSNGNEIPLCCDDFSHSNSYWIYSVGECYD